MARPKDPAGMALAIVRSVPRGLSMAVQWDVSVPLTFRLMPDPGPVFFPHWGCI